MEVYQVVSIEVPRLGEKIYEARVKDPRSLRELCRVAGISPSQWQRIESEVYGLPVTTLRCIESALGIDFDVIIDNRQWQESSKKNWKAVKRVK